jgi:hypothetical protein
VPAYYANSEWTAGKYKQLEADQFRGEYPGQMAQNHDDFIRNEKEKRQWHQIRRLRSHSPDNFVPDQCRNRKTDQQQNQGRGNY